MKKKHIAWWLCSAMIITNCSSSSSQTQIQKTGWDEYDLKGHVKQLTIRTYKADNESSGLVKGDLWSTTVVDFAEDGRLLQVEWINESKDTYLYSDKQTVVSHYEADGTLKSRSITTYNDWGGIKDNVYVTADGVEIGRTDYVYGNGGKLVERIYQDIGFAYTRETNFQYDSVGNEIRCERYNKENLLKEIETNIYDAYGKRVLHKVERYDNGAYAYGGNNRYSYNNEGFVCLVESCNDTDDYRVTHRNSYSYDTYGNYTVENSINDWFSTVKERTIVYY